MLMAALGFFYGVQIANLMGAANEVAGPSDMVLALALELFMEGVGSLIGSPLSSKILSGEVHDWDGYY